MTSGTTSTPAGDRDQNAPWRAFRTEEFAGRVVLVTGAASGMGRETARAFAAARATLVLADIDHAAVQELAEEIPGSLAVPVDIGDPASVESLFAKIDSSLGRIDHVAHCAAVIAATRFLDADPAHWRRLLDINLVGSFVVVQQALRRMLPAGGGTLVVVASDAGFRGGGGLIADAPYAASKAGVLSLVKSVAREFGGRGVRINALAPGPSDTPLHSGISDELKERIASGLPIGRMGRPADMAAAILFLSSSAASFVYGATLDVDGGAMLR
ncbi:SDR family oxidoreductase [Actinopolymorpha rutila]|uniref:3-oxoacyl-[acyl-carrier protein] reductase n=1 Tax=Actinopolymorpha rutila TaxID=446787 RepID=A0A852ZKD7_9ACTN|nr:3-oxoacyl-[acyl-carrier protein] reductase [Actinopolymorpha rutila]